MSDSIPPPKPTLEQMQIERDEAIERERKLRATVNRWQGLVQSALGNIQKVTSELQSYLRDGILPD